MISMVIDWLAFLSLWSKRENDAQNAVDIRPKTVMVVTAVVTVVIATSAAAAEADVATTTTTTTIAVRISTTVVPLQDHGHTRIRMAIEIKDVVDHAADLFVQTTKTRLAVDHAHAPKDLATIALVDDAVVLDRILLAIPAVNATRTNTNVRAVIPDQQVVVVVVVVTILVVARVVNHSVAVRRAIDPDHLLRDHPRVEKTTKWTTKWTRKRSTKNMVVVIMIAAAKNARDETAVHLDRIILVRRRVQCHDVVRAHRNHDRAPNRTPNQCRIRNRMDITHEVHRGRGLGLDTIRGLPRRRNRQEERTKVMAMMTRTRRTRRTRNRMAVLRKILPMITM